MKLEDPPAALEGGLAAAVAVTAVVQVENATAAGRRIRQREHEFGAGHRARQCTAQQAWQGLYYQRLKLLTEVDMR